VFYKTYNNNKTLCDWIAAKRLPRTFSCKHLILLSFPPIALDGNMRVKKSVGAEDEFISYLAIGFAKESGRADKKPNPQE
jgi:hypothetical protein